MDSKETDLPSTSHDGASSEKKPPVKCYDFFLEWKRCISAYHQFHQYYIHGEFANCRIEKKRMYNCFKWRGTGKEKFINALEWSLEQEQLNMHTPDPIWELRKSPPEDWANEEELPRSK